MSRAWALCPPSAARGRWLLLFLLPLLLALATSQSARSDCLTVAVNQRVATQAQEIRQFCQRVALDSARHVTMLCVVATVHEVIDFAAVTCLRHGAGVSTSTRTSVHRASDIRDGREAKRERGVRIAGLAPFGYLFKEIRWAAIVNRARRRLSRRRPQTRDLGLPCDPPDARILRRKADRVFA